MNYVFSRKVTYLWRQQDRNLCFFFFHFDIRHIRHWYVQCNHLFYNYQNVMCCSTVQKPRFSVPSSSNVKYHTLKLCCWISTSMLLHGLRIGFIRVAVQVNVRVSLAARNDLLQNFVLQNPYSALELLKRYTIRYRRSL